MSRFHLNATVCGFTTHHALYTERGPAFVLGAIITLSNRISVLLESPITISLDSVLCSAMLCHFPYVHIVVPNTTYIFTFQFFNGLFLGE